MKYKPEDIVYYCDPFVFIIEKIRIDYITHYVNDQNIYIDSTGAYVNEEDLFDTLDDARNEALKRLSLFCEKKQIEILTSNPQLDLLDSEDNDD